MSVGEKIDRLIGVVAPVHAARRSAARMMASYYRGARSNRLNYNWSVGQESVDTTISSDLHVLRNRSRDLNRNNAIAAGLTDTICQNAIHTGIIPQSNVSAEEVRINPEAANETRRQAEKVWRKWSPWADAACRLNINEIELLAARQIVESGEFLAIRRALPLNNGRPYMLALDIIEPDRLQAPIQDPKKANIRFGVEMNGRGEPITYHIRKSHPGDMFPSRKAEDYKPVPAKDKEGRPIVFHIFPVLRPGQTRGIPFFAPVIEQFKILADYMEAELVAARVAACFAAFIKMQDPYQGALGRAEDTNTKDQRLEALEPGMIEYLGVGEDVTFAKPERPGTTFDQFVERILRMIGASLSLPYELVMKDFSKTNYSSARAALLQAYRVFQGWQAMITNHLNQPLWELLFEEGWLRGEITAPGYQKYKWEYTRARWIAPGWQWVDPMKEAKANEIAVKNGFKTRADVCAEWGQDWEEKTEQMAREKEKYEKLGLPWMVQKTGPESPNEE